MLVDENLLRYFHDMATCVYLLPLYEYLERCFAEDWSEMSLSLVGDSRQLSSRGPVVEVAE